MAADFSSTGAFNVNGQFATRVQYDANVEQGRVGEVNLRFANGRTEIATAKVQAEEARDLLGEKNFAAIEKAVTKAVNKEAVKQVDAEKKRQAGQSGEPAANEQQQEPQQGGVTVKGALRGKTLDYRQVVLADFQAASTENAIYADSRVRAPAVALATMEIPPMEIEWAVREALAKRRARDFRQASEALAAAHPRDPSAQDKLSADLAQGKDVRTLDAATAATRVASGENPDALATLRRLRASAVPDAVGARFLKMEDKFYFPDKTLAFVDKGTKLKAASNNVEVVRSLVAIAEARDWQALSVTGTQDFRREVWREASLRGIDVRGYAPSELERMALRRALEQRHGPNEVARETPIREAVPPVGVPPGSAQSMSSAPASKQMAATQTREAAGRTASPEGKLPAEAKSTGPSASRSGQEAPQGGRKRDEQIRDGLRAGVTVGVLLEHGAAPYQFNQDNDDSYYVKIRTERGEQIKWGVDLARAVSASKTRVQAGDVIGVEHLGNRPVTVKHRKLGQSGQETVEAIETHRNAWSVEKMAYFQQQSAKAQALRNSDREPRQELVHQHPDLADAAINLWLGEQVAKKKIERPQDQARFVAVVKERLAQAIERGEPISAPKLRKEVARLAQTGKAPGKTQQREPGDEGGGDATPARRPRSAPPRAREPGVAQHAR